jgi:hypothetical protein
MVSVQAELNQRNNNTGGTKKCETLQNSGKSALREPGLAVPLLLRLEHPGRDILNQKSQTSLGLVSEEQASSTGSFRLGIAVC